MAEHLPTYTRPKNSDCFEKIQELVKFYGVNKTAALLGVKTVALSWRNQPIPVVRLAYLLHRLTFEPGRPVTLFDLLTVGKYHPNAATRPQGGVFFGGRGMREKQLTGRSSLSDKNCD